MLVYETKPKMDRFHGKKAIWGNTWTKTLTGLMMGYFFILFNDLFLHGSSRKAALGLTLVNWLHVILVPLAPYSEYLEKHELAD